MKLIQNQIATTLIYWKEMKFVKLKKNKSSHMC